MLSSGRTRKAGVVGEMVINDNNSNSYPIHDVVWDANARRRLKWELKQNWLQGLWWKEWFIWRQYFGEQN